MRYIYCLMLFSLLLRSYGTAQDSLLLPKPQVVPLEDLVMEVLARNPVVLASLEKISIAHAHERQSGVLEPPELTFRRNEMAGFRWPNALSSEWELMQMVRFPSKYSTENSIGEIQSEHSHHESQEVVNGVLLELRQMYAELWFVQQRQVLEHENLRITERLGDITASRYKVGKTSRTDMLMAEMLRTTSVNSLIDLRQMEVGLKVRLSAMVDRQPKDTIGYAVISEDPSFGVPLDTLLVMTRSARPMVIHDSLGIREQEEMLASAKQEYLPDLRLGVSYMDSEMEPFGGWSVSAGITIPFLPWNLGKTGAVVEEAEHRKLQAEYRYAFTRNMVNAEVRAAYSDVTGTLRQLQNLASSMLPAAEQALKASLSSYENGEIDYLMVHQAYTAFLGAQTEYFSMRLAYEKYLAKLRFATGYNGDFQTY